MDLTPTPATKTPSEEAREGTRGFTLVEILLAVLLVSILSAVGIGQYLDFTKDARTVVTQQKLAALKLAITGDGRFYASGAPTRLGYEANCLGLPGTLTDLVTQPGAGTCASAYNPYTKQGWRGPYVSNTDPGWDKDAWGHAIQYFSAGPPARTLRSCGADGACGNADDITLVF